MTRALTWLFHALPLAFSLAFGRLLGRITFDVLRIRRRTVLGNLAFALPELPARERKAVARRTYLNLGMMIVEFLRSARMTEAEVRERLELDGWEHIEAALARGRGLVVVTAHFGNWEFLATGTALLGLPLHVISKRLRKQRLDGWWRQARARTGLREIPTRGSIAEILKVLRRNEVLGVVIDQNVRPPRGIFVPFFGRAAATLTVPSVLAERTGAPIVTAFAVRLPGGRHRLTVRPFEYERVGDRTERVRRNTERLNRILEDWIRRHPDHWLWLHRRWKTRPPEESAEAPGELAQTV